MVKVTSLLVKSESALERVYGVKEYAGQYPANIFDSIQQMVESLAGRHLANRLRVVECHLANVILGRVFAGHCRVRLISLVLLFIFDVRIWDKACKHPHLW